MLDVAVHHSVQVFARLVTLNHERAEEERWGIDATDDEIDGIVYGLTAAEIRLVEESTAKE